MAFVTLNTSTAPFGTRLVARFHDVVEATKERMALHAEFKRTANEMYSLTDRELSDIGISRYDIHEIATAHVYGK